MFFFQVVSVISSRARPHLMHTYTSADDPALIHTLSFEIQKLKREVIPANPGGSVVTLENLVVSEEDDTQWMSARSLADFDALAYRMFTWKTVEPSDDQAGVMVLSEATRAKPMAPLMDPSCPTLLVYIALKQLKWTPVHHKVVHTLADLAPGAFDGRLEARKRFYFQVLLALPRCAPLTSAIPSTAVQKFFKLLLLGVRVEPGLPDTHYAALMDARAGKNKAMPIEDIPAPPSPRRALRYDDDDGIMVDVVPPEPKRHRGGGGEGRAPLPGRVPHGLQITSAPGGASGSGGGGGPPGPGAPPPGPPLPPPPPEPAQPEPAPLEDDDDGIMGQVEPARRPRGSTVDTEGFYPGIGDAWIKFETWTNTAGAPYPNWIIRCDGRGHGRCIKSRKNIPAHMRNHGRIEPPAYLHAWLDMEPPNAGATHRSVNPSDRVVADYVAQHRSELEALCDRWGM